MHTTNTDKAWAILIERKGDRREDRTAFVAALIATRCRTTIPAYNCEEGGDVTAPIAPHLAEAFAAELVRLARLIKREAEAACSYERNAAQEAADERNQARFTAIATALGFEARTGGDPRGACAYIVDSDDPKGGDGWGTGWAVY